jgi:hypothetical protein
MRSPWPEDEIWPGGYRGKDVGPEGCSCLPVHPWGTPTSLLRQSGEDLPLLLRVPLLRYVDICNFFLHTGSPTIVHGRTHSPTNLR